MTDNEMMQLQSANAQNYTGAQTVSMDNCTSGGYIQTTGNIQFWPYPNTWYYPTYPQIVTYVTAPAIPTECAGDVHVFACQKCGECKCGKARMAKAKK